MNHSSSHDVPAPTQPPEQILDSLARRLHDGTLRSRQIGELGEQYAAAWLESQGWRTLDRNWHCRYGELDVVSRNPMGQIVFVEVKTRRTMRYGTSGGGDRFQANQSAPCRRAMADGAGAPHAEQWRAF